MHPPWQLCGLQGITQGISAWPAVAESVYFKVMLMLTEKHIVLHCDRVGGFTRGLLVNSPGLSPRFASSPARGRAQCSICGDTRCSELDVMNWMSRLF